jgi:phosphatidylinositol alpha-1,6-mannosyltransferase
LRALLVTTDFPPAVGGIQAVLYNTVRHFTRIGVVVVAPDHPDAQAFDENQSFPIYRVGPARARSRRQRVYRLGRMTVESLRVPRREGADVVLCGHPFTAPIGLAAKRLLQKPYVVWTYASELVGRQRFLRRFLQPADAVLVISAHTRRLVTQLGVPMERLVLIPCAPDCGLSAGVCDPPSAVRPPLLLTVARMDDLHKGHDIMLRAIPLIAAKMPNVRWVVVGDGPLRSYYEKMARARGAGCRPFRRDFATDGARQAAGEL